MDQEQLLAHLLSVLEQQKLPYAIAGSHATMAYGESRFTNDIDVVVLLTPQTLSDFCAAFPFPEFYVSEDGARTASLRGGMFNIIHPEGGLKIDVIVPKTPFERTQLDRVVRAPTRTGHMARFSSPEDTIIKKMEAYDEGGSEKHLRDITGVLRVLGDRVDRNYIEEWVKRLGYDAIWTAILARTAQP